MRQQGRGEEPPGRGDIPASGDERVDDLAVLVHSPVHAPPDTVDLDVGLVHETPVAHGVPTGAGRIHQLGSEPLNPPVQGDVIDVDAALGEQLLQIPVGQAVAQVLADRQEDHLGREPEAGERRRV